MKCNYLDTTQARKLRELEQENGRQNHFPSFVEELLYQTWGSLLNLNLEQSCLLRILAGISIHPDYKLGLKSSIAPTQAIVSALVAPIVIGNCNLAQRQKAYHICGYFFIRHHINMLHFKPNSPLLSSAKNGSLTQCVEKLLYACKARLRFGNPPKRYSMISNVSHQAWLFLQSKDVYVGM